MTTTLDDFTACKDASGNVASVAFSGSTSCTDLRIEVYDASGNLLTTGPVSHDGSTWHVSFSVQNSDFALGDIACDGKVTIKLKCRDTSPAQTVLSDTKDVNCVECDDCTIVISAAEGVPAATGGLQSLTISGTAVSCTQVKIKVAASGAPLLERDAHVVNGQWQVQFVQSDHGGAALKAYNCKDTVSIDASCDDKTFNCSASDTAAIQCRQPPGKCPDTADVVVTGPNNFNKTNPTDAELQCLTAGNYTLKCTTSAPTYTWRSSDIAVNGANSALQVVSVSGDTMVVSLTANDNIHFSVTANISDDCQPLVTVAFHCGGTTTRPAPVDCVVSPFSAWSECVNGWQTRTRTILVRPRNGGRPCPHLTERQPCTDIAVDLCIVWMYINIGLMIVTAILFFIAFCELGPAVWTAIAAIPSGGTLGAVSAALTATAVGLLITAAIVAAATLLSIILWIVFCLFGALSANKCNLIKLILLILHALIVSSLVLGAILAALAFVTAGTTLGCAIGAFWDAFAWFGVLEQIFFWIGYITGCLDFPNLFGLAFARPVR